MPLPSTPLPAATSTSGTGTDPEALIGAAATRAQYGVDGTGLTVAMIDTGVNYNNAAFGGGGFGPGHKVVAGYDFGDNSPDPIANGTQHGTSTAGIVASSDSAHPGVAPGADIAELKVFSNSGGSDYDKVADALQWVVDNHSTYHISAVNISLSDGGNYTHNWFGQGGGATQRVTDLIGQLDALNIPVVSATGNSYSGSQGEGFTAIVPQTISVTSSDANDQLASNAQRLGAALGGDSATKLAAPGVNVVAPQDGNSFGTVSGTSFAAPQVSGAVVLLQQIYEQRFGTLPTVDQLTGWLQKGADTITDAASGFTIGRLDIAKAAALIPPAPQQVQSPPPVETPVSNPGPTTPPPDSGNQGAPSAGSTDPGPSQAAPPPPPSSSGPSNPAPPPADNGQSTDTGAPTSPPPSDGGAGANTGGNGASANAGGGSSAAPGGNSTGGSSTTTQAPPPAQKTPEGSDPWGTGGSQSQVFVDGQSLTGLTSNQLTQSWGSDFATIIKSFLNWGGNGGSQGGKVQIWAAGSSDSN